MTAPRRRGPALAALAAVALGLGGVLASAPAAVAAHTALVDSSQTASVTFHKYETPVVDKESCDSTTNGGEALAASCTANKTPVAGVAFTLTRVKTTSDATLDLSTNEGWQAATAYNNNVSLAKQHLDTATVKTTGATGTDGVAKAEELPLGLYYVEETTTPAGVTTIEPFLVTLPMTNAADTGWNYDVHVYPKNSVDKIEKKVVDKGTNSADSAKADGTESSQTTLTYQLRSSISAVTAEQMGKYEVTDELATGVTFKADESKVELIKGTDDGTVTATLTKDTDYTVTTNGQKVTMALTASGIAKVAAAKAADPTARVLTTLAADVSAEGTTGKLDNTATLIPNKSYTGEDITSNTVTSRYGDLVITKTGQDTNAALAGATFDVYRGATGSDAKCATQVADTANRIGTTSATGTDGKVTFKGLQTSNFYDGAAQTELQNYCLVETKAPAGYQLLAEPIAFTVTNTDAATLITVDQSVVDKKDNLLNNLPLTGGPGVIALLVAGTVVLGGGAAYQARRRRQQA